MFHIGTCTYNVLVQSPQQLTCTCKKRMQEPPAPPLSGLSVYVKPNGHPKDDKFELTVGPWKPHDKITLDDKWGQRTRVCATKL